MQHSLNQNVHNSITKGSPVFYNPFQRLPGILPPHDVQPTTDKPIIQNNTRKSIPKPLNSLPKSLHSSQNLSQSQKSLIEAESVYKGSSPKLYKGDLSGANLPSPTRSSFLSFFSSNSSNKALALKGNY